MEECIKFLEAEAHCIASDRELCRWVRLANLADDVGIQFSIEDPSFCNGLEDGGVRFVLRGFKSQLHKYSTECPDCSTSRRSFNMSLASCRLFTIYQLI